MENQGVQPFKWKLLSSTFQLCFGNSHFLFVRLWGHYNFYFALDILQTTFQQFLFQTRMHCRVKGLHRQCCTKILKLLWSPNFHVMLWNAKCQPKPTKLDRKILQSEIEQVVGGIVRWKQIVVCEFDFVMQWKLKFPISM